ncbi:MAG: hypothetical protein ABIQ73_08935 [Acidimicrobiales bacterium]
MGDGRHHVAGGSGIAATVFIAVGAGLLGSAPKSNDLAAKALEFTSEHRRRLLVSMWLLGFGFALALVFIIGLTAWPVDRRAPPSIGRRLH